MNQMESIQTNNVHKFPLFLFFKDLNKFNFDPIECVQYLSILSLSNSMKMVFSEVFIIITEWIS